jgi:hypothetical protein
MDTHRDERLKVDVKLLGEPCLWCWEIVDTEQGALVESSWTSQWAAYESSREALSAGSLRLAELSRRSRGALLSRSGAASAGRSGRLPGSPPGRA